MAIATDTTPNAFQIPSLENEGTAAYSPEHISETSSPEFEALRAEIDSAYPQEQIDFLNEARDAALAEAIFEAQPAKQEAEATNYRAEDIYKYVGDAGDRIGQWRTISVQNQDPDFIGTLRKKVNNWNF